MAGLFPSGSEVAHDMSGGSAHMLNSEREAVLREIFKLHKGACSNVNPKFRRTKNLKSVYASMFAADIRNHGLDMLWYSMKGYLS